MKTVLMLTLMNFSLALFSSGQNEVTVLDFNAFQLRLEHCAIHPITASPDNYEWGTSERVLSVSELMDDDTCFFSTHSEAWIFGPPVEYSGSSTLSVEVEHHYDLVFHDLNKTVHRSHLQSLESAGPFVSEDGYLQMAPIRGVRVMREEIEAILVALLYDLDEESYGGMKLGQIWKRNGQKNTDLPYWEIVVSSSDVEIQESTTSGVRKFNLHFWHR